jgi:hypothetical protein
MKLLRWPLLTFGVALSMLLGVFGVTFAATSQTTDWNWSHNTHTGTWTTIPDVGAYQNSEAEWNNDEQGTFTWNYMDNLIPAGDQVYTYAWLDSYSATDPYALYGVSTGASTELNQQLAQSGWNYLFAYYVYNPGSDYVALNSNGNYSAVADAIQVDVP